MERYTVKKFLDNVWLIYENYSEDSSMQIGLVVGKEKALLIDTGMGVFGSELKDVVSSLTDLPVVCLCTHGHPDHIGGAVLFDEVYMNSRDADQISRLDPQMRLKDVGMFSHQDAEVIAYAGEHILDGSGFCYKNIDDGDVVDAGGVRLKVLRVSGHSKGSLVYYNEEDHYAFSGDAFGKRVPASSLKERKLFLETAEELERVLAIVPEDATVIGGHWKEPVPRKVMTDLAWAYREIGEGETDGDKEVFLPMSPVPNQKQHVYGEVAISYDPVIMAAEKG